MYHLSERSNLSWLSHWLESWENERRNDLDTGNVLGDGLAVSGRGGCAECDWGLAGQMARASAHPNLQKPSRSRAAGRGGFVGVPSRQLRRQASHRGR